MGPLPGSPFFASRDRLPTPASWSRLEQQLKEAEATIGQLGPELELGSSPSTADVVRYTDELDAERRELERAEDRQKRAQAAQEEVDRLGAELGAVAAAAGLPRSPSDTDLEAFRRTVAEDRGKEAAREAAVEREAQLKTAAESQAKRVADLATALDKRNEEAAAARSEWEEWLRSTGSTGPTTGRPRPVWSIRSRSPRAPSPRCARRKAGVRRLPRARGLRRAGRRAPAPAGR